jgi:hypothetical protein
MWRGVALVALFMLCIFPSKVWSQAEVIELLCPGCGYRQRFVQGTVPEDVGKNVQSVILVCERSREIRAVKIPLNPNKPVHGEPLVARQFGMGTSKLLGIELPKFLIPGNTCPLFPVTAYLDANVCPIDGHSAIHSVVLGHL